MCVVTVINWVYLLHNWLLIKLRPSQQFADVHVLWPVLMLQYIVLFFCFLVALYKLHLHKFNKSKNLTYDIHTVVQNST